MAESTLREITFKDSAGLDAFGRNRVSTPDTRWDVEFLYDKQPLLYDEVIVGAGSVTHNSNPKDLTLAVGSTTTGDEASMYSHVDIPYTAGNSQLVDITGVYNLANIGGGVAQVFFRTKVTGSVVETTYDQNTWDSNITGVDWADSHILAIDFQSLKVGRIRVGLVQNGIFNQIKAIHNDNVRNTGYWQQATLPQAWRIYNDATYTYMEMCYGDNENAIGLRYRITKNATATMKAICTTVKSEGGQAIQDLPAIPFTADRLTTPVVVSTTLIPVLSIRLASTFNSITNRSLAIPKGFDIQTNNPIYYCFYYRPTLTGAVWTANDSHSGIEYDITASAVTGGYRLPISGYATTARNVAGGENGLLEKVLLSLGRTGTSDILSLCAVRTDTTNANVLASIYGGVIR